MSDRREKLYTSSEAAKMIGIDLKSVSHYYRTYGIGKIHQGRLQLTEADIKEIMITDGRKNK